MERVGQGRSETSLALSSRLSPLSAHSSPETSRGSMPGSGFRRLCGVAGERKAGKTSQKEKEGPGKSLGKTPSSVIDGEYEVGENLKVGIAASAS